MSANPMAAKRKPQKNQSARFPGSIIVSREAGVSHSHLYRVLLGERRSERLVKAYSEWLTKNGLPWPKAAKVALGN